MDFDKYTSRCRTILYGITCTWITVAHSLLDPWIMAKGMRSQKKGKKFICWKLLSFFACISNKISFPWVSFYLRMKLRLFISRIFYLCKQLVLLLNKYKFNFGVHNPLLHAEYCTYTYSRDICLVQSSKAMWCENSCRYFMDTIPLPCWLESCFSFTV